MSTIASGMHPGRTNRWLLIGAAAFALFAGIATFALVSNISDDGATPAVSDGDAAVLVASQTIEPNTRITERMFVIRSVSESDLVDGAVTDRTAAIDKVARAQILEGEQISAARLALTGGEDADNSLAVKIPSGKRAVAVGVDEVKSVAGLLVPGDRVDVLGIFTEDRETNAAQAGNNEIIRVETVLQDVEVLAFAQESLDTLPAVDAEGNPIPTDTSAGTLGERPEDAEPQPSARTVTLALAPHEVQLITAVQAKGQLTLAMRPPGEPVKDDLVETNLDDFGLLPPLARPGN